MGNETIFESVGRLLFTRERVRTLETELNSAGIDMPADAFAGYVILNVFIVSFFISLFLALFAPTSDAITSFVGGMVQLPSIVVWVVIFIATLVVLYFIAFIFLSSYVVMKVEDRREKLEAVLPDFLILVSSNIKAGMTLDQAMWYAAKPEFGPLTNEVRSIVKGSFSGESLEDALDALSSRFDSKVFKRTMLLLKQANTTGGELTDVLERTAEDVRNTIIMKKEIGASLVMYEIFVLFAAIVGTPFLFAVAGKLIEVFERIAENMPATGGAQVGPLGALKGFSGPIINSTDFLYFTIPTIFVTALISSFIISAIRSGSKTQGLKYFPFVLVLSYLVYWIVSSVLSSFFATFS
ncbi:type II secretion system F family protein [Candidatus Micrarchaeota archaeon]|nr:type II secretion system F family protein [Candidatus Micrarchaeota archaeon]